MIVHLSIYIHSIVTHPNVICVPYNFSSWALFAPVFLVCLSCIVFIHIRECRERKDMKVKRWFVYRNTALVCLYMLGLCILCIDLTPNSCESGTIVTGGNSSNVMYQHIYEDSRAVAYPIFFDNDDINVTHPDLNCTFVKTSKLCSMLSPLWTTTTKGAFKCRPGGEQGLELFSPLQGLLFDSAYLFMKIAIAFLVFFSISYTLIVYRRILPPDEWIGFDRCHRGRPSYDNVDASL
jgi:hypothetical protein